MARLPVPNGDADGWGTILNQYLGVGHNDDGTHKSGLAPDATPTDKGSVRLAGDLSGTADVPTVPGLSTRARAVQLDLRDFGAVGDGVADDGPALQAALDGLAGRGGGELRIPPGVFALRSGVSKNLGNLASSVRIVGTGSSSQLLVAVNPTAVALQIQNVEHLVFENLTFVGTPGVRDDAYIVVRIEGCTSATFWDCSFYGLATVSTFGGATISSFNTDLRLRNCAFRGCTGGSSRGPSVVDNVAWTGFSAVDCEFLDFGTLNGHLHSKTPISSSYCWIALGNTYANNSSVNQTQAVFRNVRMDEGSYYGIGILPTPANSARIGHVLIEGCRDNVSARGNGVYARYCDRLTIRDSWFGYNTTQVRSAIILSDAGDVLLDGVRCEQLANRIQVDSFTRSLTVNECIYTTLASTAKITKITKNGSGGVVPRLKPGPITDADFDALPPDGTLAVDTANAFLYVRIGGAWRKIATAPAV